MRIEPQHFRIGPWQVRPNLCTEVGDPIHYHVHDTGHLTLIRRGRWRLKTIRSDGKETVEELASAALGQEVLREWVWIEAGDRHEFVLLETERGTGALWCMLLDGT